MAGMVGLNVEEVRALATRLNSAADEFSHLAQQLTSSLGSTTWVGNDRSAFESEWQSSHMTAINNVVTAVRDAATKANQNAQDQENVSNG